jgi:hypothetical protein
LRVRSPSSWQPPAAPLRGAVTVDSRHSTRSPFPPMVIEQVDRPRTSLIFSIEPPDRARLARPPGGRVSPNAATQRDQADPGPAVIRPRCTYSQ